LVLRTSSCVNPLFPVSITLLRSVVRALSDSFPLKRVPTHAEIHLPPSPSFESLKFSSKRKGQPPRLHMPPPLPSTTLQSPRAAIGLGTSYLTPQPRVFDPSFPSPLQLACVMRWPTLRPCVYGGKLYWHTGRPSFPFSLYLSSVLSS